MKDAKRIGRRSRNGSGTTYRVGGSWKTVIQVRGQRVSATSPNRIESRRLACERANRLLGKTGNRQISHSRTSLEEFAMKWINQRFKAGYIAETTMRRYLGLMRTHISPVIGKMNLQSITRIDINAVLNFMTESRQSPRSKEQARALLHRTMNLAMQEGFVHVNVVSEIHLDKYEKSVIRPLSESEVLQVLKFSKGTFMHARLYVALILGLRQGEALSLRWSNIDFGQKKINIESQARTFSNQIIFVPLKTISSRRSVYLSRQVIQTLEAHRDIVSAMRIKCSLDWVDHDLVFPNNSGRLLSPKLDYKRWQNVLKANGIDSRSLHSARHTAGTLLYEMGNDIETIRRILGHSNIGTTSRIYLHSAARPLEKAALRQEDFLSQGDCD